MTTVLAHFTAVELPGTLALVLLGIALGLTLANGHPKHVLGAAIALTALAVVAGALEPSAPALMLWVLLGIAGYCLAAGAFHAAAQSRSEQR